VSICAGAPPQQHISSYCRSIINEYDVLCFVLQALDLLCYQVVFKELIGAGKQDDVLDHLLDYIRSRPGQCGIIYARLRWGADGEKCLGSTMSCMQSMGVKHWLG